MVTTQIKIIEYSVLENSDKWLINFYLAIKSNRITVSHNIVKLKEIVIDRNETIDPQKHPEWDFAYVGLENIESNTGVLTDLEKKAGKTIKSRAKIFYGGDLLYGKLRPSLNKVHLVDKSFGGGICSTEIFVLMVKENTVPPAILRFLLSTQYVLSQVKSYTAGAALPRIHINDFLNVSIPLPEPEVLSQLQVELEKINSEIVNSRKVFLNSGHINEKLFESYFGDKKNTELLKIDQDQISPTIKGTLPF